MDYPVAKHETINIIDNLAYNDEVLAGYGDKYNAKTPLAKIRIGEGRKIFLVKPINKTFAGDDWTRIGPQDAAKCQTIGDVIKLVCLRKRITLPAGEPK